MSIPLSKFKIPSLLINAYVMPIRYLEFQNAKLFVNLIIKSIKIDINNNNNKMSGNEKE